jgi:hypothetical protein
LKYQNNNPDHTNPITPTQYNQRASDRERGVGAKNSKNRNKFKILKKTKETNVEQKFMN